MVVTRGGGIFLRATHISSHVFFWIFLRRRRGKFEVISSRKGQFHKELLHFQVERTGNPTQQLCLRRPRVCYFVKDPAFVRAQIPKKSRRSAPECILIVAIPWGDGANILFSAAGARNPPAPQARKISQRRRPGKSPSAAGPEEFPSAAGPENSPAPQAR